MLSLLLGVVLAAALLWKYSQVVKAPEDRPLRAVTLCLTCAGIAFPFGLQPVAEWCDRIGGAGGSELMQNVLLFGTVYWLMCFYLYSAADERQGKRRARWEALPLAAAIALLTLATVITSDRPDERTYEGVDMQVTGFALFYLVGGGYLVYALGSALRWTVPYARASHRPLSAGLWLVAWSMAGMVLASSVRSVVVVIRWLGGEVPSVVPSTASLLLSLVIPLFVIGVSYPSVASRWGALRIWRQHRRHYRRLYPLWLLLHEAYPQDALSRFPAGSWSERLLLRGVHRRYYRRVIECRDGLVRISPHLSQIDTAAGAEATTGTATGTGAVPAPATGTAAGADGPAAPVPSIAPEGGAQSASSSAQLAERLRAALAAQAAGGQATTQAILVAVPEGDSLDADAQQLVALADALHSA